MVEKWLILCCLLWILFLRRRRLILRFLYLFFLFLENVSWLYNFMKFSWICDLLKLREQDVCNFVNFCWFLEELGVYIFLSCCVGISVCIVNDMVYQVYDFLDYEIVDQWFFEYGLLGVSMLMLWMCINWCRMLLVLKVLLVMYGKLFKRFYFLDLFI